jgi:hypothetical protein
MMVMKMVMNERQTFLDKIIPNKKDGGGGDGDKKS